jgi:hypothetical protein
VSRFSYVLLMTSFSFDGLSRRKLPIYKLWIITESDRSVTTLLLPEEY